MTRPDLTAHWIRSPITTRHSQTSLLLVSLMWGLSYCMPAQLRIPFSEVFPPDLNRWSAIPMWGYGAMLLASALVALAGERLILGADGASRVGWQLSFFAHAMLCAMYFTLAVAALVTGFIEARGTFPGLASAASRPVLWGYIGYLHVTYARLPRPDLPKRKRRRRKLRMVYDDE